MSINAFSHLKEVQSLDNMIKKHLDKIREEEGRLDHILALRKRAQDELDFLTNSLTSNKLSIQKIEKELFDWEKRLKKTEESLPYATNEKEVSALELEKNLASQNVDELQNQALEFLEEQEQIEGKIEEKEGFLKGSLETLEEIKEEIKAETATERIEIEKYETRIEALKDQVPPELWRIFLIAREKHRFNMSLARIINKGCEKCRFILDAQTAARIEAATAHELCSQCGRLLIPLEA